MSSTNVQGIKAKLESDDPDPVFSTSAFWVMLHNDSGDGWAQVGWMEVEHEGTPKIFAQISNNTPKPWAYTTYGYNKAQNVWTTWAASDAPDDMKEATVTYDSGSPNGTFKMYYDGGPAQTVSAYSWVPTHWAVMGEVSSYGTGNKGDHFPGNTSDEVLARNIQSKSGGSWANVSLPDPLMNDESDDYGSTRITTGSDSPGLTVWDKRCSS